MQDSFSQAVLSMQDNFSSAPDMNIMKHIPPVISAGGTTDSSADLPVPPTEKRPKPKMRALRTRRIRRFVRFNVRTSDVEEALARNSIAFATSGISSPAYSMVCLLQETVQLDEEPQVDIIGLGGSPVDFTVLLM